jgi:hypothetical protein
VAACQYSHGEDCQGLCVAGVTNQFSTGGPTWGGGCAVPCKNDGGDAPIPHLHYSFMVAGDSISHGMNDDWTWRYRLTEWCT